MALRVVPSRKHRVLETHPALAGPVVLADEIHHLAYGPGLLDGHELHPLFAERIMQTYGQMSFLFVEISFQIGQNSNAGDGYALRTPGETPVCGEHFDGLGHLVVIVERLAHAHEHGVGEFVGVANRYELVEDVADEGLPLESSAAGHAELAVHAAAGLRRHAEGMAVAVGNHHGFDSGSLHHVAAQRGLHLEKVLERAVAAFGFSYRRRRAELIAAFQDFPSFLRNVCHFIDGTDFGNIQPAGYLFGHKRLESAVADNCLEFCRRFAK